MNKNLIKNKKSVEEKIVGSLLPTSWVKKFRYVGVALIQLRSMILRFCFTAVRNIHSSRELKWPVLVPVSRS